MKYDFDLICIGLGPAGMAVSVMGSEMGLKVCAIEKNKIGGECMNVGCIPSKSLLRISKYRNSLSKLKEMGLMDGELPDIKPPFSKIAGYLEYISNKKTLKMFEKVTLMLSEGSASFVDSHTVSLGDKSITAQKIFIATGTEPMVPPIDGISNIDILTNSNVFNLTEVPKSMTIIGGGAIGSEMAQAFTRLGTKCTIVQMDPFLIPLGDKEAGDLLEDVFKKEGIDVYNSRKITSLSNEDNEIVLRTEDGLCIKSEKLLMAAGRKVELDGLKLENAGVKHNKRAIEVDSKYRTSVKHIYAVGDCNGGVMLSHAAMHQGMFAIMNAVSPFAMFQYKNYVIPWTVFTEPQVSYVGMREEDLKKKGIKYETHIAKYEDYGAAIAENVDVGFVKVFTNSFGKVFGASIVGEGSGEMINEWALIIQKKIRLHNILFLAHSFPTMGFLTKRIAEMWMMKKMNSSSLQKLCRFFYQKV
ncbi:MAG: NAD(P)/FAD-dependent oxidoreductase [Kiritimatiellae bacterium]|jgi:pyruvate/2-oxoglutarate dehydrogenase complex dihydrolipoamide dehydrogenase (E3) component|nr:NAD(P)/FAD-dependent oxidoreductase [Kiritimatiellia bacterium]